LTVLPLAHPRLWLAGALLIAGGIIVASLLPGPIVATVGGHDKLEHAGAYWLLTLWVAGLVERRGYPWAAMAAFALGATLEVAQGFLTATREADPLDLVANGAGIAFALALAYLGAGGWAGRLERRLGAGS
jgi:VanZ family protein